MSEETRSIDLTAVERRSLSTLVLHNWVVSLNFISTLVKSDPGAQGSSDILALIRDSMKEQALLLRKLREPTDFESEEPK